MDLVGESGLHDGSFHVPFTETDVQSFSLFVLKEIGAELYQLACFIVIHDYASLLTMTMDVVKGRCLLSATFGPVLLRVKLQKIKMFLPPPKKKSFGIKSAYLLTRKKNGLHNKYCPVKS